MPANSEKLVVILGPTATGKTKIAVKLASKFHGEIISADSRQVYRGMDIGTGKDLAEYRLKSAPVASKKASGRASRGHRKAQEVPYHLIDIISPKTPFNVARYQQLAYRAIGQVQKSGQVPFLVGGTGLYIDAVVKGFEFSAALKHKNIKTLKQIRQEMAELSISQLLARLKKIDLETYKVIDQKNRRRVERALEIYYQAGQKKSETDKKSAPDLEVLTIGIKFPLEKIYKKIDSRLEARIKEGMVKEIKKLRRDGVSWKRLDEFGLEYRFVSRYLRGLLTYDEMLEQLRNAIHHFAKRQLTWFKRNPDIVWVENYSQALAEVKKFLK